MNIRKVIPLMIPCRESVSSLKMNGRTKGKKSEAASEMRLALQEVNIK